MPIVYLLAGLPVGFFVGLIFTPRSGKENRAALGRTIKQTHQAGKRVAVAIHNEIGPYADLVGDVARLCSPVGLAATTIRTTELMRRPAKHVIPFSRAV